MAALKIVTTQERRPCIVHGKKAFFHTWANREDIVLRVNRLLSDDDTKDLIKKYVRGGYIPSGIDTEKIKKIAAIVEYDDGTVAEVLPQDVRFTDIAETPRREGTVDKDKLISVIKNEAAQRIEGNCTFIPEMILDDEEIERLADCVINYLESEVLK